MKKYCLSVVLLYCVYAVLGFNHAAAASGPTVTPGNATFDEALIEARGRSFGNTGGQELYLGVQDAGDPANRAAQDIAWAAGANSVSLTFDSAADKLVLSVDNANGRYVLEYPSLSAELAARKTNGTAQLNLMQIDVVSRDDGSSVAFNDVMLDGNALGSFSGSGFNSWTVADYDFSQGFALSGTLELAGPFSNSQEKSKVGVTVGYQAPPPPAPSFGSCYNPINDTFALTVVNNGGAGFVGYDVAGEQPLQKLGFFAEGERKTFENIPLQNGNPDTLRKFVSIDDVDYRQKGGTHGFNPENADRCTGTLTIIKNAVPDAKNLDWAFDGDLGPFTLDTDEADATHPSRQTFDVAPGSYAISETNAPANWDVSISCEGGNGAATVDGASVTVPVERGEAVTCTFLNQRRPQIQIIKYSDDSENGTRDEGEPTLEGWQMFLYVGDGAGGYTQIQTREVRTNGSGVANYTSLSPDLEYLVCEEDRDGWVNTQPGASAIVQDGRICQAVSDLSYGETRPVLFGNYDNRATLTIVKNALPNAANLDWTFDGDLGPFTLDNDAADATHPSEQLFNVESGTFTVVETNKPANWVVSISCEGGANEPSVDGTSVTVQVARLENVTCTFLNQRRPQIQITKYSDDSENGARDEGEPTLEGWQMFLYVGDGAGGYTQVQTREVRTNGSGVANYTNLEPGVEHLVCEEDRGGWINSEPGDSAVMRDGRICQIVSGLSFGEVRPVQFGNYEEPVVVEMGGVIIKESSGVSNVTEGNGSKAGYSVRLSSQPSADVTITIQPDAQVATDKASLTFTPANWDQPQPVLITAVDDGDIEGPHLGFVNHGVSSSDPAYNDPGVGFQRNGAGPDPRVIQLFVDDNDGDGSTILVSSNGNGSVGGVAFRDEDILAYDPDTDSWRMIFDGSDVGIYADVNAFAFLPDGSLLLSSDVRPRVPGVGQVDDSDIVRFTPASLGANTSGSFELYFDGSDVGLSTNGEDIDALHVLANGDIVLSTLGSFRVPGVRGMDEDLLRFTPTSLGGNTAGAWSLYFDGSDVELTRSAEDVWGTWIDPGGEIYLTTQGNFRIRESQPNNIRGDGDDIFICAPTSLGDVTACDYSLYWSGGDRGLPKRVDGIHIGNPASVSASSLLAAEQNDAAHAGEPADAEDEDIDDGAPEGELIDEETSDGVDESTVTPRIHLPLVRR